MKTFGKHVQAWIFAVVVLILLGFPIFGLLRSLQSDGIQSANAASWAQAIGTIWAIAASCAAVLFQVERARKIAIEADETRLKRKYAALCAILDDAYEQCKRVEVDFMDADEAFGMLSFLLTFDERSFEDAIRNVEKIPLPELESYEAVRSISRFRNRLISIKAHVLNAMDKDRDTEGASDYEIKRHVRGLIADAEEDYGNTVSALGGKTLEKIAPFIL